MYRTKPLGMIFDEQAKTYRPLYQAIGIRQAVSPSHVTKTITNTWASPKPSKQIWNDTINKVRGEMKDNLEQNAALKRIIQIDARVRSPQQRNNISVKTPKISRHKQSYSSINNFQKTDNQTIFHSPVSQRTQDVRKKVITHSTFNKSYQDVQTYIPDQSASVINSAIHQLLEQLRKRKNNQNNINNQQAFTRLNQQLLDLSQKFNQKNNQVLILQNQLKKSNYQLSQAGQGIQHYQNKLRQQQNYGSEARKKLRQQIDVLKQAYEQLVIRIQTETSTSDDKNNYKQLYERAEKQLLQYKKLLNNPSIETTYERKQIIINK